MHRTRRTDTPTGVLLMAYGTPDSPEDVEAYFTHIRGGRRPSTTAVDHLKQRYALVGGRTPLLDITRAVGGALQQRLDHPGSNRYRVYVGMKHWHPYIGDTMRRMMSDGIARIIAVTLAPHYSRMSVGGYHSAVGAAQDTLGHPFDITFVDSWHMQPEFIALIAELVRGALDEVPAAARAAVLTVFSAHSLPERIRTWQDPYETQLLESCAAVAARVGLTDWRFAWQSAGRTGEPWIGPDICDYLATLHADGVRHVLQVPIGFVCDHLEILYDIDYEARSKARELGMTLRRTPMPNDRPAFIRTLAAIVTAADHAAGARPAATPP
jgi:ferrochelatase